MTLPDAIIDFSIRKTLSSNDLGLTGSHQAGILVPKQKRILGFFPQLSAQEINPSREVNVLHLKTNRRWQLRFVYYNGKLRNSGTRNEFRLTKMTELLRTLGARTNDVLIFRRTSDGDIHIELEQQAPNQLEVSPHRLVLRGGWVLVDD